MLKNNKMIGINGNKRSCGMNGVEGSVYTISFALHQICIQHFWFSKYTMCD